MRPALPPSPLTSRPHAAPPNGRIDNPPVRPLHLLLLSPALPPAASGNARQAARLKKHLRAENVVMRLAAADEPPARLLRAARRFRPDLIWGLHLFKSGPAAAR